MAVSTKVWAVAEVVTAADKNIYEQDNFTDLETRKAQVATGEYVGDGTTSNAITGLGFEPIVVWIEQIATADNDPLVCCWTTDTIMDDIAGGNGTVVFMNTNGDQTAKDNKIISLDADGFTVSDDGANLFPNQNTIVNNWWAFG